MASKNAYFFELKLKHQGKTIEYVKFKEIITDIIEKYAMDFSEYKSLDATPYEEEMHLMLDVYEYDGKFLFARMTKQRPSNSLVQHDYKTYEKEDVLPGRYPYRRFLSWRFISAAKLSKNFYFLFLHGFTNSSKIMSEKFMATDRADQPLERSAGQCTSRWDMDRWLEEFRGRLTGLFGERLLF